MDGPRKKEMWRSRRNRERHSDGDLSAVTAAPPANETPLTEEQIQQKIKENNVKQEARWRDEQERLRRHRHWSEVERREWAQEHPNADWTNEELDRWRENHQYFVPQPSWHDQLTFRQQHQRRFCLFDRRRRIYYYPSDIATQTVVLPSEFTPLSVNGRTYYYADGVFYSRDRESFSDVPAPLGALVSALPAGYAAITVGGVEYATSGGVYYKKVAGGYEVTDPPPGFEGVTIENAQGVNGEDAVIVGIPNPKLQGDFIDIKLVRSGSGFTGPQGEGYDAFPSIEQLKDMYLP